MSEAIRHGEIFLALSEPPSTAREAHAQTVVRDLIAALRTISSAPPGEKRERIPSGEDAVSEIEASIRKGARRSDHRFKLDVASPPPAKAGDGLWEAAILARDRLVLLMHATLPSSDHPVATQYVLDKLRAALAKEGTP